MKRDGFAILLLGLFDTSIMTARCLRASYKDIFGLDYDEQHLGFFSNLIKCSKIPDPNKNERRCVNHIVEYLSRLQQKVILIPTSDEFVKLCSDYRAELMQYCQFLLPEAERVNRIIERRLQFHDAQAAGIMVPEFLAGEDIDVRNIQDLGIRFPLAVKPANIIEWRRVLNNKGYVTENPEDLADKINFLRSRKVRHLVQQIIEGDNTNNFEVNTLYLPNGQYFQHAIRKIRQYPDGFGTATCIEACPNPVLEKQAIDYIRKYKLTGFTNIEFKYSREADNYYFIETNTRVWLQVNYSKQLGINFPDLYCSFLEGRAIDPDIRITRNGKWVDFLPDILFWKKYRKKYGYSLPGFVKSWKPVLATSLLSLRDPLPFLRELRPVKRLRTLINPEE